LRESWTETISDLIVERRLDWDNQRPLDGEKVGLRQLVTSLLREGWTDTDVVGN